MTRIGIAFNLKPELQPTPVGATLTSAGAAAQTAPSLAWTPANDLV